MKKVYFSYSLGKINPTFLKSLENELKCYEIQVLNREVFNSDYYVDHYNIYKDNFQIDSTNADLANSMQNLINKCDLLIAFLTDTNYNVIFELGYALGKGKKILLVSDENVKIPNALENVRYIRSKYNDNLIYDIINYIESVEDIQENNKINDYEDFKRLLTLYVNDQNVLDQIEPNEFEDFIYEWFKKQGINSYRNENSVDVDYDFLLTDYYHYKKTLVEVKKYNSNSKVSVGKIQQFLGAIYFCEADHGIFISSSGYTKSAINFAKALNGPKIELWDIEEIIKNLH
ncbi:hypothetical protein EO98_09350 [Methanosarcina sp. 2.H.T.1A.6]|uniref:restriction endonuclease n=1 Tax=unclassified Methanosarcina TaxID=2644672 RepID=UPI0006228EA1|nr:MULTISPECIES: restriction endonuclease [unclassified Methanosarcina]KKG14167.1 hypothetical protein EO94_15740 [Methanosarcina sp. 2.H.T.1A.3]KKG15339.1 hypothetical protein EO97_04575 [Methanosarcina sp. 2.H.T.1A.15]KKG19657.1 hypothetical protein EO98_09350 [Methanosarcina sp. 2.H.T.1A.6]KKG24086.1 hypothetical protein EO96_11080 [Methanosarcina sp. 2.H.T.1A.8]